MKKFIIVVMSILALVSFQSCDVLIDEGYTVNVTTLDVTDVSHEGYTFNATIEYKGSSACLGEGGVLFGGTAGISEKNYKLSSPSINLKNGVNQIHSPHKNYYETLLKNYYFSAGETVYYRAYAKVLPSQGKTEYTFGEEKSFVMPE